MHRIDTSTKQVDKFGSGKHGFTLGNPGTATPATVVDETIMDSIQEEICNVIESTGETLDKEDRTQLLAAVTYIVNSIFKPIDKIIHVQDVKANGTNGGTFNSGAWRVRDLNTEIYNNIPGASLSGNKITLPAGTYEAHASAPHNGVGSTRASIYNFTASTHLLKSLNHDNGFDVAVIRGVFTLSVESEIQLVHYAQSSQSGSGFGVASPSGAGDEERYAEVMIRKIS